MAATYSSPNLRHLNKNMKNRIVKIALLAAALLLFACDSKINRINIHGTYKGGGISSYEAVVDAGTITIYSISFFEKTVYWYGTCNSQELDENNKLISKRLDTGRSDSWFSFDFGFGKSGASEKEILFTENSLTFIYDMRGMAINQVTLYKEGAQKKYNEFDSNAEKADPNYVEPSKPLPHEIPRGQEAPTTEAPTEKPTENPNVVVPGGNNYSL